MHWGKPCGGGGVMTPRKETMIEKKKSESAARNYIQIKGKLSRKKGTT